MNEIRHFGIKGMRWGVRRYQNEDGSLTPAGKKRYSKEYEKLSEKVTSDLQKKSNDMYIESYNRASNSMNSGGIDKFNASQRKKYGEKYAERERDMMKTLISFSMKNSQRILTNLSMNFIKPIRMLRKQEN